MTIGEQIKNARKNAGMTQSELARKLNIPYQSIGQWETGRRIPKRETLEKISRALGIGPYDLIPPQEKNSYGGGEGGVAELPSWEVEFEMPPIKPASIQELLDKTGMSEIELADFLMHGVWVNLVHRHDCTFALHLENAENRAQMAWALHVILRELRKNRSIRDDSAGSQP